MKKKFIEKLTLFCALILARPILLAYRSTLSVRIINSSYIKNLRKNQKNFIIALWHENMILPLLVNEDQGFHVLVSQHFDGELIARILYVFGYFTIRGSSTRGGKEAYLTIKNKLKRGKLEIAITPDGPTGPRRKAKLGIIRLASETGSVIIPLGIAVSRCKRLQSWDRLLIIFPFSKCVLYYGKPVQVPADLSNEELEKFAHYLTTFTNSLDQEAEKYLP
jgi:lysophospholipid acyltransferase (LPLAT)-like uncharacterized protein